MTQIQLIVTSLLVGITLGAAIAVRLRPTPRVCPATIQHEPNPPAGPFRMVVDEVRQLRPGWDQTIVGGTVSEGEIRPGNTLFVKTERYIPVRVIAIVRNHTMQERATEGEWAELLLGGVRRDQIERTDVVTDADGSHVG